MYNLKFSIIIPTYKGASVISETLKSILNQKFDNYEIIIHEDASNDNIEEVIKSFNDSRIKFYRNEKNLGYSINMEEARKKCDWDVIYLMWQDDIMSDTALIDTYNAFMISEEIWAVTRPYFWFDKSIDIPVRAKDQLNSDKDEIVKIDDEYNRVESVFRTLDQLSGLAYRVKYMKIWFHEDCFPCHIYPFVDIFKNHPVVFLKDYNIAVRIATSQTRFISWIYERSPMLSRVDMVNGVLNKSRFDELRKNLIEKFIATNYVWLVQLRNYARYYVFVREIYYLLKFRIMNLFSFWFWFFSLGCLIVPPFILIPMVDKFKNKFLSNKFKNIKFTYKI